MRADKHFAIQLRKSGKSYKEIYKLLKIPLGTLSSWFKNIEWSQDIKDALLKKSQESAKENLRLMSAINKKKWDEWHQACRDKAAVEFPLLKRSPIFIAGLMLYWGEGDKVLRNCTVRLVNSDPDMIKVFYLFLQNALRISKNKIIIKLTIYPDLDDGFCRTYWSEFLGASIDQFRKSVTIIGRHPTRRLSYGICSMDVYSREIKEKILVWIELFKMDFQKTVSVV